MKYRNSRTAACVATFWGKSQSNKDWYDINANASDAEIMIYDVIGWPFVDADTFVRDLNRLNVKDITVSINSPGGDVFDGTAIYNALKNHPANITTRIDGLAASMASIIALAGDRIEMAENAYYMIHNPWSFAIGDEYDMHKEAELLRKIGGTLAGTYAARTGATQEESKALMDAETWFTGTEAAESGFVDKAINTSPVSASFELGMYANAPNKLKSTPRGYSNEPPTEREFERLLRESGFSRSQAAAIVSGGYKGVAQREAGGDILTAISNLSSTIRGN
jgi:ATP-dependent Clp protease, protease subunit